MRLITGLLICLQIVVASTIEIKDGDAQIQVNGNLKTYHDGESFTSQGGESICFIKGDGRVVIDGKRQLTNRNKECFIVPIPEGFNVEEYVQSIKDKVYVVFFDSTERVRHGVSTKGTEAESNEGIIHLPKEQDLLIFSDRFGPLPVTVTIFGSNGNIIFQAVNKDDAKTFVSIPYTLVEEGTSLQIINGFNQTLLKQKIIIK